MPALVWMLEPDIMAAMKTAGDESGYSSQFRGYACKSSSSVIVHDSRPCSRRTIPFFRAGTSRFALLARTENLPFLRCPSENAIPCNQFPFKDTLGSLFLQ